MSPTFEIWYHEVRILFGSWGRNVLIRNECECSRSEDDTKGSKWSSVCGGGGIRRPCTIRTDTRAEPVEEPTVGKRKVTLKMENQNISASELPNEKGLSAITRAQVQPGRNI